MIVLKTQSPAYWQSDFVIGDEDLEVLHSLIIEKGTPVSIDELVLALIKSRCQREIESLRSELDKGPMYQPRDRYEPGQTIVFPAFSFSVGTVVDSRLGFDPSRGEFTVIGVEFANSGERREFASQLDSEHVLNRKDGDDGLTFLKDLISAEELAQEYGQFVHRRLLEKLTGPENTDFVHYNVRWLVREMLAEVHVGHINIAEAAVEIAGKPLTTDLLLKELDLPSEIGPEVQRFSLNAALGADERFVDAGWDGHVAWFLQRLVPETVLAPPRRLVGGVDPYDRSVIHPDLLEIEKEIDDEALGRHSVDISTQLYSARITLTYPHLRSGTLPLSQQVRTLFPKGSFQHTRVELVEAQKGQTMVGWMNHEYGYIAGLSKWYAELHITPGAFLRLERTKKPGVVVIDVEPRRMRREWVRVASIDDGKISFGMQKRPISNEYDELFAVDHVDPGQIDEYVNQAYERHEPLEVIVRQVVPELIKLNPAGTVHAKTVFSAVNMFRRCSAGAVFAILSQEPRYVLEGNGLLSYDESKT